MQNKNKKQKQEKNKKTITLRYLRLCYRLSDPQTYTHSWREMKKDDEHWGGKEDLPCCEPSYTPLYSRSEMRVCIQTRPDTRQDSRGRLGKGCNAKKCSKLKKYLLPTYRPTWQGVESRVRDYKEATFIGNLPYNQSEQSNDTDWLDCSSSQT